MPRLRESQVTLLIKSEHAQMSATARHERSAMTHDLRALAGRRSSVTNSLVHLLGLILV